MTDIVRKISPCHCINFRQASNILTKYYNMALEPLDLSVSQFSLLIDIQTLGSSNKSDLAKEAGLDRTTIIRNLKILKDKEFVADDSKGQKSFNTIRLTDKGESIVKKGLVIWNGVQQNVKNTIGEQNIKLLDDVFENLEDLVD